MGIRTERAVPFIARSISVQYPFVVRFFLTGARCTHRTEELFLTPTVVYNVGLDIADMDVEHNESKDEDLEERIAWFLESGYLCKLLYCTLRSTQFITPMLQVALNECRQLTR